MTGNHASLQPVAGAAPQSGTARRERVAASDSIEARLDAGEGQLAARALLAAVAGGSFLHGAPLEGWLHGLSEPRRARLMSAFAHYPCFACRNGQDTCDACGGSGFSAAARVCAACAGLGEKRCDFCAGSGLAAYNAMPVELWLPVLIARATRARRYLEKLAAQPPALTAPNTEALAIHRIMDLNKLLGVLENALGALRQLSASGVVAPQVAEQFVRSCNRAATAGIAAMREALRHLADHHKSLASTLPPVEAANAEAKAEFYEDLTSETFEGTGLSHPFLHVDAPP